MSDLNELSKKIEQAQAVKRAEENKNQEKIKQADDRQGAQAGIELVVAIGVSTAIGYGLDQWLGTKPLFIIVMFFLGVCTGFYNVYRISQNIGTAPGSYNPQKNDKNALPEGKKDGKTPSNND